jgi:hypothetical protein
MNAAAREKAKAETRMKYLQAEEATTEDLNLKLSGHKEVKKEAKNQS